MKSLSEKTLLPISFVILIGWALVWVTTLFNRVEANSVHLQKLDVAQEKYNSSIEEIKTSLSRIEGELKRIRRP